MAVRCVEMDDVYGIIVVEELLFFLLVPILLVGEESREEIYERKEKSYEREGEKWRLWTGFHGSQYYTWGLGWQF